MMSGFAGFVFAVKTFLIFFSVYRCASLYVGTIGNARFYALLFRNSDVAIIKRYSYREYKCKLFFIQNGKICF